MHWDVCQEQHKLMSLNLGMTMIMVDWNTKVKFDTMVTNMTLKSMQLVVTSQNGKLNASISNFI